MKQLSNLGFPAGWLKSLWRRFKEASPARRVAVVGGIATFVAGTALLTVGLMTVLDGGRSPVESHVPRGGIDVRASPTPTRVPTNSPTSPPAETPQPEPPLPQDGYLLVIEKLGISNVVDTYGLDENAIPVVPTGDDAAEVIAWYEFSARPGTGSNAVFAGHNSWFGDAVFTYLHELEPGDEIRLVDGAGAELVYSVTDVFSVDPNDPESLRVMHATDTDVITLITCGGDFVDTNDPVFGGEFSDRVIVRGDLKTVNAPAVAAGG